MCEIPFSMLVSGGIKGVCFFLTHTSLFDPYVVLPWVFFGRIIEISSDPLTFP